MHSRRWLRTGRAHPLITANLRSEQHFGAGVHLFDLDAGQMRKELLEGITQPDNESPSDAHHTVRTRARE